MHQLQFVFFVTALARNVAEGLPSDEQAVADTLWEEIKLAEAGLDEPCAAALRLSELEASLKVTYAALPKNAHGNLGHQAVRYVLHRHFLRRYGWYLSGLGPSAAKAMSSNRASEIIAGQEALEWLPSYLQELLEQREAEEGTNVRHLAALAAALEDRVHIETRRQLQKVFLAFGIAPDRSVARSVIEDIARTYFCSVMKSGNFSTGDIQESYVQQQLLLQPAPDTSNDAFSQERAWMQGVEAERQRVFQKASAFLNFEDTARLITQVSDHFNRIDEGTCRTLKATLVEMESFKAGRVRLSTFYKRALSSHYAFTEKADFLRSLGALDESDAAQPHVIIPNYLTAFPNCMVASGLHAVCCRNECEDLLESIEREVGTAEAPPHQLAALVASLPSATVTAPRVLAPELVDRLHRMAESNGDRVPIHGRLFAQWMHHAYPRECPYPHELGTISPKPATQWSQETGLPSSATAEEMQQHVSGDTCAIGQNACTADEAGGSQLPWSEVEELLVPNALGSSSRFRGDMLAAELMLGLVAALALGLATRGGALRRLQASAKKCDDALV